MACILSEWITTSQLPHTLARARARIHTHGSILVSWINNNNSSAIWFTHWCDHHLFIWFSCMSQKETIPIPNRFAIEYKFLYIISFCVLLVHYTAFSYTCLDYCVLCLVSLFQAYARARALTYACKRAFCSWLHTPPHDLSKLCVYLRFVFWSTMEYAIHREAWSFQTAFVELELVWIDTMHAIYRQ